MQWDEIKITELSSCSTESEWLQSGGSSLPGTGAVPPERLGRRRLRRPRRPVAGGDAASLPAADPQHPRPPTTVDVDVDVDVAIESGDVDGDDDDQIARRKLLHPIEPVFSYWWQHFDWSLSSSKTSWRRIRNGSVGFRSIRHRNVSSATGTIRYFCWWILFGTGWSAAFDPIRWTSGRMLADWNSNRRGRTRSTALDPRRLWCDDFARIRCSSLPPHPRRGRSTTAWHWLKFRPSSACRLPSSFVQNEPTILEPTELPFVLFFSFWAYFQEKCRVPEHGKGIDRPIKSATPDLINPIFDVYCETYAIKHSRIVSTCIKGRLRCFISKPIPSRPNSIRPNNEKRRGLLV